MEILDRNRPHSSGEHGNAIFYVLFVLPIVMVLLMIVVDLSNWQSLREEARRHADRIVLETAQYLPYETNARKVLEAQANFFNSANGLNLQVSSTAEDIASSVGPSSIDLTISGKLESGFDAFLETFSHQGTVFTISEKASARLLPTDLTLILSDSVNLRPPAPTLWGNPIDWPRSEYFNFVLPPTVSISPSPAAPLAWPNWWSMNEYTPDKYMRFATELCYNPVVTPLKLASLLAVDALSAGKQNRISVYMTPGDIPSNVVGGSGYTVLQNLKYVDETNVAPIWSNYFEPDIAHSDEACLLYSHADAENLRYRIPDSKTLMPTNSTACPQVVLNGLYADPRGHYPNPYSSYLSTCFKEGGMTLREAIYYHGVRRNQHDVGAVNISRSILHALTSLVEEEKINADNSVKKRGGLAKSSAKIVILISEVLPSLSSSEFNEVLNIIRSVSTIKLYLIGYSPLELSASLQLDLSQREQEFLKLNLPRLLVEHSTPDDIQEVIGSILANEKKVVLSS